MYMVDALLVQSVHYSCGLLTICYKSSQDFQKVYTSIQQLALLGQVLLDSAIDNRTPTIS